MRVVAFMRVKIRVWVERRGLGQSLVVQQSPASSSCGPGRGASRREGYCGAVRVAAAGQVDALPIYQVSSAKARLKMRFTAPDDTISLPRSPSAPRPERDSAGDWGSASPRAFSLLLGAVRAQQLNDVGVTQLSSHAQRGVVLTLRVDIRSRLQQQANRVRVTPKGSPVQRALAM